MKIWVINFFACLVCVSSLIGQSSENELQRILEEELNYGIEKDNLKKSLWTDEFYNYQKDVEQYKIWMKDLKEIDHTSLESEDQITLDFLLLVMNDKICQIENKAYLMPLNAEGGFLTSMLYNTQYLILSDDRKEDYIEKLSSVPSYIERQIGMLREGLQQDITVPKLVAQNSLNVLENQLEVKDSSHFLMKPIFRTKDDQYVDKCLTLFASSIRPSFEKLTDFIQNEYIPKTRSKIGISYNRKGKAYYEQRVQYYTTLDLSPKEVYDIGIAEVARIKSEMELIIEELQFEGSFSDFFEFLRTDKQFYAPTGKALLQEAAWLSKKAEEFLPQYFEKLPSLPFTVKRVPDNIAPTYTAGRYSGGSYKEGRAGSYWVNTYDLPSRPLYSLPALTLHEAVPGHHLQGSLAQEMEDVPKIRSKTYLSAFGEGWALYCEYLGKEAGYYKTAYDEFGRLTYEMWRACRLVVDPGIHYYGWTRDEAVKFMAENTALSLHEVNTEIDRYIGWPGQAVSYKIGELKIRELRKRAEQELGDNFDIRQFHNEVLKNGSIPLSTLERNIDQYITKIKDKQE